MSQTNCNCGCAPHSFHFQPTERPAVDCFFMQKVNQVFSSSFDALSATFNLQAILSPTDVLPVAPYTFVYASSGSDMSEVTSIVQLPNGGTNLFHYQFDIAVPTDLTFVDSTGREFFATGTVNLRVEVTSPLTYEQISQCGLAVAITCFEALTGGYVNESTFSLILCGGIDIIFVSPGLMRVRHEGECSFIPPLGEHVHVVTTEMVESAAPIRIR